VDNNSPLCGGAVDWRPAHVFVRFCCWTSMRQTNSPWVNPLERAYSTSTNALLRHRTGNVSRHKEGRPISNIVHRRSRAINVQVCTKDLKRSSKTNNCVTYYKSILIRVPKNILSRVWVPIDEVWIGNRIYWNLKHIIRDLHFTNHYITQRLVFSVTVLLALLGNVFQQ
jgi:hypothetical protein